MLGHRQATCECHGCIDVHLACNLRAGTALLRPENRGAAYRRAEAGRAIPRSRQGKIQWHASGGSAAARADDRDISGLEFGGNGAADPPSAPTISTPVSRAMNSPREATITRALE